jgi:hypothetical protein
MRTTLESKLSKPFVDLWTHLLQWEQRITFSEESPEESDMGYTADQPMLGETINLVIRDLRLAAMTDLIVSFALHNERGNKSTISRTTAESWKPFQKDSFYFLKRHPIRCGLMLHPLYSRLHELRLKGTQQRVRDITWLSHLYVAGKILEPEGPRSLDMDWPSVSPNVHLEYCVYTDILPCCVIDRQGVSYLFGDDLPTTFA